MKRAKNLTPARVAAIAAAFAISGCAVAPAPIAHTPNVVATAEQGQLAVSVAAAPTVGEVTPVYVSIANGTDADRSVVPSQVFALNDAGERVAPIPPGEAARQAGSAKELARRDEKRRRQRRRRRCRRSSGRSIGRRRWLNAGWLGLWLSGRGRSDRHRIRRWLRHSPRRRKRTDAKPTSRPISKSTPSPSSPKTCARTSPSAATSSSPRAHTTRSRCCWLIARPATPKSSANPGTERRLQQRRNNHDCALPLALLGGIANHRFVGDELHVRRIHQARGERTRDVPLDSINRYRRVRCRSRRQICPCPRSSTRPHMSRRSRAPTAKPDGRMNPTR